MRTTWLLTGLTLASAAQICFGADTKAILWQPPGEITLRDWIWGRGGQACAPQPPYEFIEEDFKGTNAKVKVRDAKGNYWIVKFGGETHGDVFGSRLLYALGYLTQPTYFVAGGTIAGVHNLKRAKPFIARDGGFSYARFKLRDHKALAPLDDEGWSWNDNPFVGTKELNGLKILIMLTSNWDAKDSRDGAGSNTAIYAGRESGASSRHYAFNDWGATMGKWGGFFKRDKWDPSGYRDQTKKFARLSTGQIIEWGYRGKHSTDITSGISAEDVRWLLTRLSPVTDEELRAGLRASGASEPVIEVYTQSIRDRITQLQRLAAVPAAPPVDSVPLTSKARLQ
jgi:hypothetical protein